MDAVTRARDLHRTTGNRYGEAGAWNNLGTALRRAGRREEAIEAHGRALEIFEEFVDSYETGQTLQNLALDHWDAHCLAKARAHWLQAAEAYARANAPAEAAQARAAAEALG